MQLVNWTPSESLSTTFPQFANVRVFGTTETPLFVAKDVEQMLQIKHINYNRDYVENEEYVKIKIQYDSQTREVNAFTEHGLYQVIYRTRSPVGDKFRKFVTLVLKELRINKVVTLETALGKLEAQLEEIKKMKNGTKQVYFIRETDTDWVKIGHSKHPVVRFDQAKTWNPRIELVAVLPVNISESDAHEFARQVCSEYIREWFNIKNLDLFIRKMEFMSETRSIFAELPNY